MKMLGSLLVLLLAGFGPLMGGGGNKERTFGPYYPLWPDAATKEMPAPRDLKAENLTKAYMDKSLSDVPGVIAYLPPKDKANGAAVVICPGGGYGFLAADHEGEQIARWLNDLGVAGIVLRYRLGPTHQYPKQLHDAQRAVRFTRARAKEWGIDPQRVGILGFSAGGHLASTALTQFDAGKADTADPLDHLSCRPDFGVLMYPVIRLEGLYSHGGSRINLLGKDADSKLVDSLNNDKRVTKETPPTFLVHTTEDTGVPPENSAVFYMALNKHKVPAEMHIFEKGRHGLGLGPKDLPYSTWPDRCAAWLKSRGLLEKK